MDEDGSCFGRVRKAKKTVPRQPRAEISLLETHGLFRFRNRGDTLIPVWSVRPFRPSLGTELADQPVVPEQKCIRLKTDIRTIGLPGIDQSVNLIAVLVSGLINNEAFVPRPSGRRPIFIATETTLFSRLRT
jgi:hypothetical protein